MHVYSQLKYMDNTRLYEKKRWKICIAKIWYYCSSSQFHLETAMILIQSKSSSSHRHPSPSPQRWENHSRIVVIYCLLLRLLFHRPIQHQFSNNSNKNTQHHQPQQPTKIIFFPMMLRKNEKKMKRRSFMNCCVTDLMFCSVLQIAYRTAYYNIS